MMVNFLMQKLQPCSRIFRFYTITLLLKLAGNKVSSWVTHPSILVLSDLQGYMVQVAMQFVTHSQLVQNLLLLWDPLETFSLLTLPKCSQQFFEIIMSLQYKEADLVLCLNERRVRFKKKKKSPTLQVPIWARRLDS